MSTQLGTAATQDSSAFATAAQGAEADAAVKSVVAGSSVIVDNTDPQNPIISASSLTGYIVNPATGPALSSIFGGALAATTYYAQITYVNSTGETLPSPESNLGVSADYLLVVDSPSPVTNATGYNVYISTSTGTETKQNSTPIPIGTNWTEPTSGLISGSILPSTNSSGNVVYSNNSPQVLATITQNADTNGNYLGSGSTSSLTDNAGLGTTAGWATVTGQPTTLSGYGITNGQASLGVASGTQILYQTSGGGPYWGNKYGTEFNSASTGAQSNVTGITNTTDAQLGYSLRIANPGQQVNIFGFVSGFSYQSAGTAGAFLQYHIEISTDGGSTYSSGNLVNATCTTVSPVDYVPAYAALFIPNVTPSGDILIRLRGLVSAGTFNLGQPNLCAIILPESNFAVVGPALSASVPSTATASCTATYPATTCAAPTSITCTASGGAPPYTYSWSRTGGTGAGTIVSGATSLTVNVSGTETGTSGGTSYTDTYQCVVTDTIPNTANGSCTVTSTYYLGYATISPSISVVGGSCSTGTSSGTCTAAGTFSISATGGNGSYTYSNSVYSHDSGFSTNPTITAGATAASGTYSGAATTSPLPGTRLKVTLQTSVNDTRGTGAQTATGYNYLTFKYTSNA